MSDEAVVAAIEALKVDTTLSPDKMRERVLKHIEELENARIQSLTHAARRGARVKLLAAKGDAASKGIARQERRDQERDLLDAQGYGDTVKMLREQFSAVLALRPSAESPS